MVETTNYLNPSPVGTTLKRRTCLLIEVEPYETFSQIDTQPNHLSIQLVQFDNPCVQFIRSSLRDSIIPNYHFYHKGHPYGI
jgi:hypothetical protein